MTISINPLHPVFVGEVSGVDTTRPCRAMHVAAIEAGMDRYAVLVFRDQRLTDEQQLAFSRSFGALEETRGTGISKPGEQRLHPAFADVSNIDKDNRLLERDNRRRLYGLGNMLWHSDSSFKAVPAKYSILSGRDRHQRRRQYRIRRHARRLCRAGRRHQGRDRRPGLRTFVALFARGSWASPT